MKLQSSLASPFGRKVRVMLAEKQLLYELEKVEPFAPAEVISGNPLGQVPALVLDGGLVLCDALLISQALENMAPEPPLLGIGLEQKLQVAQLEGLIHGVLNAAVTVFTERNKQYRQSQDSNWFIHHHSRIEHAIETLERQAHNQWLVGDRYSMADISAGILMEWLAFRLPDLTDRTHRHQRLWALTERLNQHSPHFAMTAPAL